MSTSKQRPGYRKRVLLLGMGLVSMVGVIIALHVISPWLPGMAGTVFKNNMEKNFNAEALLYTEVVDVKEFLNRETGRYGIDLSRSIPEVPQKP